MEKTHRKDGQLSRRRAQVSADTERAMEFLRQRHPIKTAEEVAAATGGVVSTETVRKWLTRASSPSFMAFIALIEAYGPIFLAAAIRNPPLWLQEAVRRERLAVMEKTLAAIQTEMDKLGG